MNRKELVIWAAGFFDGEGCISVCRSNPNPKKYHYYYRYVLTLQVGQQVKAPLEILKALFGGNVLKQKTMWCWKLGGKSLIAALEEMLPYLVVKAAQARIAIAFQGRKAPQGTKYQNPRYARELDEKDYQTMRILKKSTDFAEEAA